jgi:hypothetical protein
MSQPLDQQYLYVGEDPVLSLADYQAYAYGLPEDANVPSLLTRWLSGEDVGLSSLLECFRGPAREVASSSDESLEIVRRAVERLEALRGDRVAR